MPSELLAYVLLALGVLCIVGEMFFFTGGILAGAGVVIALVGCAVLFVTQSTTHGTIALLSLCIGLPILMGIFFYCWPYSPLTRKLMRVVEEDATVAGIPANQERENLVGRLGRVLSALRPSGVVDFDGRRIDVISEGLPIEPGQWVKCVVVQGNKVVVRPANPPSVTKLEEADFS